MRTAAAAALTDRVLVVEDEDAIRDLVLFTLRDERIEAFGASTGAAGLEAMSKLRPAVVVLDLMLPDMTGMEVCRRLRAEPWASDVSIVVVTARCDEYDRVVAFELGVEDYVMKPFSPRELVLRIRGLLRRPVYRASVPPPPPPTTSVRWRDVVMDHGMHRVAVGGREIALRPLEYKLLAVFLAHPTRVFSRAELLTMAWGVADGETSRTVDTHVRRLREKLGARADAIETVFGFGYKLRDHTVVEHA